MRKGAKSVCLTLLSLLILVPSILAQDNTRLRVDGARIKSYIEHLSTDQMMGRQSMTSGYQVAAVSHLADGFAHWPGPFQILHD